MARGGSRGLPRKNVRDAGGRPLIAWTIEAARTSLFIDRLIVSSEDEEILSIAKEWGAEVPFVRPAELARDETGGSEPLLHALRQLPGFDYAVLLQPTSPLRLAEDIDGCIRACIDRNVNSCVSVTVPEKSPFWTYFLNAEGFMNYVMPEHAGVNRRQDLPITYSVNGAVYVVRTAWFEETRSFIVPGETLGYPMPRERSMDIDHELDLFIADCLLRRRSADS